MKEPWNTALPITLVSAAVAAEINLARVFLRDWREQRNQSGRRALRQRPKASSRADHSLDLALHPQSKTRLIAALLLTPCITSVVARGQSTPNPQAPAAAPTPDNPAAPSSQPADDASARRALPSPWNSPPFPGSEYLGPTIGVPNSTPDYALMHALKGTGVGKALSDNRIDVYGWMNTSWNLSTSKNTNTPNTYDMVPNRVELNQAVLRLERNPDTVQTDHADWGFRMTNMYGTDYRFTVAKGWFDRQLLNHNDLYGYDMPEAYGLVYVPKVADGMVLKFGRFISPPDIEAQLAPDNYLFTHSTMFSIDPYTFTGILSQIKLDNNWTIEFGAHAGADMAPWSDSASLNGHLMGRWVSNDNNDSIWAGVNSLGDGKYRNGHDNLQQVVGTWSHRFTKDVHMASELYYMWQHDALMGGTVNDGPVQSFGGGGGPGPLISGLSDSIGFVNYFQVGLTDQDYISIRTDYLGDFQGQRTGYKNNYSSNTIGWSHNLNSYTTIRPELKYERGYNTRAYDGGNRIDQLKFGIDLIVRF